MSDKKLTWNIRTLYLARAMRWLRALVFVVAALGGAACKSTSPDAAQEPPGSTRTATATVFTNRPSLRPVQTVNGRVIAVRPALKFVIVDFTSSKLPVIDQRMNVYRLDQKVAEVKISGPYLGATVAADITAGQVQEGDLVRDR